MPDAALQWNGDLLVSSTGDLALASATSLTEQRVLRRLLTNAGDYIWQPTYGAGLGLYVGSPLNAAALGATIRSQLYRESNVAQTPSPTINVQQAASGVVYVQMLYADAQSGTTQTLSFSVAA